MIINKKLLMIILCGLLHLSMPMNALIYGGVSLVDPNNQTWVTFFKDVHLDAPDGLETLKQTDALIENACPDEQKNEKPVLFEGIVVEDLFSYSGKDPQLAPAFQKAREKAAEEKGAAAARESAEPEAVLVQRFPRAIKAPNAVIKVSPQKEYLPAIQVSPLSRLYDVCKKANRPIINAETRHKAAISEGGGPISCAQVWQDWFNQVDQIKRFAQSEKNPLFKQFYEETAEVFTKETLHFFGGKGCPMSQHQHSIAESDLAYIIEGFRFIEGKLFDCFALHALRTFMANDIKHILVVAGGAHCETLVELLQHAHWKIQLAEDDASNSVSEVSGPNTRIAIKPLNIIHYCKRLRDTIDASKRPGMAQKLKAMLPFGK